MSALPTLAAITPVILTYNEEPNIGRTLASLSWASRVVVVDSGSTDATLDEVGRHPGADVFPRRFDSHARQWSYAISETRIDTPYVLALDADMAVSPELVAELERVFLAGGYAGGVIPFEYWILGRPLRGSILRPQLRIFRRSEVRVSQDGHTQAFAVAGATYQFSGKIRHDDRKSLDRWVQSQVAYSKKELERVGSDDARALKDRLRRLGVMPMVAAAYTYARSGGPLGGRAALRYTWERVVFECLLAMRWLDQNAPESKES